MSAAGRRPKRREAAGRARRSGTIWRRRLLRGRGRCHAHAYLHPTPNPNLNPDPDPDPDPNPNPNPYPNPITRCRARAAVYHLVEPSAIGGAFTRAQRLVKVPVTVRARTRARVRGRGRARARVRVSAARYPSSPVPPRRPPPTHSTILAPTLLTTALFCKGLSGTLSSAAHHPFTHPGQTFFHRRRPTQSRPCLSYP